MRGGPVDEIGYGSLIGMAEAGACGRDFARGAARGASGADREAESEVECICERGCGAGARQGKSCGSRSSGAGRGKNALGTLHGVPSYGAKLDRRGGAGMRMRQCAAKRLHAGNGCAAGGAAARSRRDHSGKYQRAGIPDGVRKRQFDVWAREQSLGPNANGGRVERRGIGGDRGGMLCGRSGQRWRRIDSHPGAFHRNLRTEADTGTDSIYRTLPRLGGSVCLSWRGGADGADGTRCGAACRSDGGARSGGSELPPPWASGGGRTTRFAGCAWPTSRMMVRYR